MVIVATPPDVRIELIKALAQAGKHILLEKPVARTLAEAEQVVSVCEREDVLLGVLFQHRMEAEDYAVAGLHFKSGAVGSLVASTATYPYGRESIAIHCPKGSLCIYTDVLESICVTVDVSSWRPCTARVKSKVLCPSTGCTRQ